MKLLRQGSRGADVQVWQNFLRGRDYKILVDGDFGPKTVATTKRFQRAQALRSDGVVGSRTWGVAMALGLGGALEDIDTLGADWPPRPTTLLPFTTNAQREKVFGAFEYESAPTAGNPEAIRVLGDWSQRNIRPLRVALPNGSRKTLRLHVAARDAFNDCIEHWRLEGLLPRIWVWDGSYVPRFIRGSRTTLSNHAFGSAIDVNMPDNRLGHVPALRGQHGSVRELVQIANEHGICWGGHYKGRLDGQHFELGRRI